MPDFTSDSLQACLNDHEGLYGIILAMRIPETAVRAVFEEARRILVLAHVRLAFSEKRGRRGPVHVMPLRAGDWVGIPNATRPEDLSPVPQAVIAVLRKAGAWPDIVGTGNFSDIERYELLTGSP